MIISLAFFSNALPRFAVSPLPFNAGLFLEDFRQALSRCGTPHFPDPMQHRYMAQADELDTAGDARDQVSQNRCRRVKDLTPGSRRPAQPGKPGVKRGNRGV